MTEQCLKNHSDFADDSEKTKNLKTFFKNQSLF